MIATTTKFSCTAECVQNACLTEEETKRTPHTSVRHILRPCRRCLVWHFKLRRMQWCTHKASVAPASFPFKRQWMQLHWGYHIGAV